MNGATIATIVCVCIAVAVVIGVLIRAKIKGKKICSCGGDCSHCGYDCPSKDKDAQKE